MSVLAKARCDNYKRSVLKNAIKFPFLKSLSYSFIITGYYGNVNIFEKIKINFNNLFAPIGAAHRMKVYK